MMRAFVCRSLIVSVSAVTSDKNWSLGNIYLLDAISLRDVGGGAIKTVACTAPATRGIGYGSSF